MLAASAIVTEMNAIALRHENGLGTVGFMQVWPNSRNTIPGNVKFSADLRNPRPDVLLTMHEELADFCEKIAKEHDLEVKLDPFWYFAPVEFNASDDVKAATEKLGYSHMDIYAGAGHRSSWCIH
jgi:N-carbamoyl-L-amino-acid hydrolase